MRRHDMSFVFNADEIFDMAEQIEKSGGQFYRKSAQQVGETAVKDLLLRLASMEDDHLKTFINMRSALSEKERQALTFDPDNEAGLYLSSLARTKVFFEKEIDTSTLEGIFKTALTAEKDSIIFYLGMLDWVPENLGRDKISDIINEEKKHIRLIGDLLADLKK
jgi:rubrerythrin